MNRRDLIRGAIGAAVAAVGIKVVAEEAAPSTMTAHLKLDDQLSPALRHINCRCSMVPVTPRNGWHNRVWAEGAKITAADVNQWREDLKIIRD